MSDIDAVRNVLTDFLDVLSTRVDTPHILEEILHGDATIAGADVSQRPETFTENQLIYPLLDTLGNEYDEQPYGEAGDRVVWPDFKVTNLSTDVIGENKGLNLADEATSEIKDYLDRKSIGAEYGITTDGIEWKIYKIELTGDVTEYPVIADFNLRPVLIELASENGLIGSTTVSELDVGEELKSFVSVFNHGDLETLLSETAPRQLRDERKRDVEEFYELYIELLFGKSDEYDYDTCLMDDIRAPDSVTDYDKRLFAVTLMNRLLFIKFLEVRGVLNDGFLRERVETYQSHSDELAGNLYETQIKPLFYKLLDTPFDERDSKYRGGWFTEVPYLNGGLFQESVAQETEFTIADRTLPIVVSDLIEGSELELNGGGFDPAVLGSVFEKTITHIEAEREQKDRGAYYTPNDVTDLVNQRSVDPKIKDEIIDAFVGVEANNDEEASFLRDNMSNKSLSEILRHIEEGEGFYASPDGVNAAFEALSNLKIIDPACGSGHFLTSAMDEIYRAQMSLLRGLNHGDDPDPERRYEVKKNLALNAIYGVDVDRVATEIAKLRVWLKIVQGNSWQAGYGKLPNIDVNITDGNTLVGLPVLGLVESLDIWDEDIEEYAKMRQQYKYEDEGDSRNIERFMREKIQPRVDAAYLDRFKHTHNTTVEDPEEFDDIINSINEKTLYPTLESVKVKREDGSNLTEADIDRLDNLGFKTYKKSARLDVQERESTLKNNGVSAVKDEVAGQLRALLSDGFQFEELERQPVAIDLRNILGRPFHWPVEFPEVAQENGTEHSIHFDMVLGNPPYGDIMSESENVITATYRMAGTDIAAPFVERQLQILAEDGYFGNVTTAKLLYKAEMDEMQDIWRDSLDVTRIASFGKRPSKVFEGAEVRVSIITGRKETDNTGDILTSEFIRFDNDKDRESRFRDIEYRDIEGYTLRKDGINGDGKHIAIPKIGLEHIEEILHTLRDYDQEFFIGERELDHDTDHVIWRREGGDYFVNPMLEKLYNAREVKPFYFETELDARAAFLAISSSIFYIYWCVYGDMFHLNLGEIRAFPLPPRDELEANRDDIMDISDRLWDRMQEGFDTEREEFENYEAQKPIIEEADAVFGEMYGLSEDTIEFVQNYHSEYGRSGVKNEEIDDF